ncbi:MAG: hypothetical protein ACYCT9_11780 [Leptospirillum sp.]
MKLRLTRVGGASRSVTDRSTRPTPGCFLSPGHWKTRIMLAKGSSAEGSDRRRKAGAGS